MKKDRPTLCGYLGAILMAIFAFHMNPMIAVVGLLLLSVQSVNAKLWNLVALNAISVCGFFTQLV
jgi:hypothetical protein